jgi:Uma2 family endonuclease
MALELEPPFLIIKPGLTEADFYDLADEDSNWEYLDGRLVMASPASERHEDLFSFLITLLRAYADENGGAVVRGSRFPMRLDPRWSPEPDILVVRTSRRHLITPQRLEGPADMVIEITSESDPGLDVREKLPRYRDAAIDEIWIVDRFSESVRVDTRRPGGYDSRTMSSGRLESAVIPGFWIEVSWLWQTDLPPTLECLRQIMGWASPPGRA